jgi:hypothetical protein
MGIIFFSLAGPVGDYTGAHTVFFSQDFFLNIILQKEERNCDGQVGEGIVFFRVLTRVGWMGRGVGNIINQSLGGPVERYTPLAARVRPEEKHFVSGNIAGFSLYISSERSAKLRWVGREAQKGAV